MKLYVTGGRERKRLFKDEEEWKLYDAGLILEVDSETGDISVCVRHVTPPEARAGADASVFFKAGELRGDRFYTCTSTEVMVYRFPGFQLETYISLPVFNDCHHVCPTPEGNLLVTSTGLDMVFEIDPHGGILREFATSGADPWQRFSRDIDYRQVLTTKPHHVHPNFAFRLGEQVWVTRLMQRDAICLTHPGLRIPIGIHGNHDGLVHGDRIYFTTVDGTVVVVCRHTLQTLDVIDLNQIQSAGTILGWCRGILALDERLAWVGFTRVRKTRLMENLNWIKHAFRDVESPTRIALYDLQARTCLKEINLEPWQLHVLFGIYCPVLVPSEDPLPDLALSHAGTPLPEPQFQH